MHYAVAKLEQEKETTAYRVYMSENLRGLSGTKVSFWDWSHKKQQPKDTRTGDQIVFDVIKGAGLKFKSKGGEE